MLSLLMIQIKVDIYMLSWVFYLSEKWMNICTFMNRVCVCVCEFDACVVYEPVVNVACFYYTY